MVIFNIIVSCKIENSKYVETPQFFFVQASSQSHSRLDSYFEHLFSIIFFLDSSASGQTRLFSVQPT